MLSIAEAEAAIAAHLPLLPTEDCQITLARERVLRASVTADRDLPPYDRVTMDGFALSSEASLGTAHFRVSGLQAAGMIPQTLAGSGTCIEVATGAVLPAGADCVVPYEEAQRDGDSVTLQHPDRVCAGANVHRRGSDHHFGDPLIQPGVRLSARELAVLASIGCRSVRVAVLPRIAVIATGDELVDVDAPSPAPHQVRRSNDLALASGLIEAGYPRVERFHFRDVRNELQEGLRRIITEMDVVLISGGVSKGKYDFLPSVLEELGVNKVFHGVAQRPGKPFWFGLTPRGTPVFALPGNPVSTYTCFRRYVVPALARMSGATEEPPAFASLASPVTFPPPLALLLPVKVTADARGVMVAEPNPTNTSGDFSALVGTDGFLELPRESAEFPTGSVSRFWRW